MRRVSELHADWLQIVEPEGQFLSLPVLKQAFPNGLDSISTSVRDQVRDRFPKGTNPTQDDWDRWEEWLLRDVLQWGPFYVTGEEAGQFIHAKPSQGIMLRAHGALLDPETSKPRALLVKYSHGTQFGKRSVNDRWNASPLERLALLCKAHEVQIGILSDGERISLAWTPPSGPGGSAIWETSLFTESKERNLFQSFSSLLSAKRFFSVSKDEQLDALLDSSSKAQNDLTDRLGFQIRQAVELLVTSISNANLESRGGLLSEVSPREVYDAAVTVMMRLVVLLYAEERSLLPVSDPIYAEHYSISTLLEQLEDQASLEGDEPLERRSAAWFRVLATCRAIYAGVSHDRLRLLAYGGRLFDPDRFPFLEGRSRRESWTDVVGRPLPVDDLTVKAILEALQTLPIIEGGGRERRRLSFRTLDVEQIGHVYEGLLDHGTVRVNEVYVGLIGKAGDEAEVPLAELETAALQGEKALISWLCERTARSHNAIAKALQHGRQVLESKDPAVVRLVRTACGADRGLEPRLAPYVFVLRADLHGLPAVFPAGSLVVKQTRARKDSGTEYTPKELAEEIVRYALEPLVYSPGPKDDAPESQWRLRPASELLALKICDPAVGSGAFLVSACRYLADRLVEAWQAEDSSKGSDNREDLTLLAARNVAERCLYGVDRDPMAVEMAKLSLWLATMSRDQPFTFLDHSIREGDSLIGVRTLDQLRNLHIEPERVKGTPRLFDTTELLAKLVSQAAELRRQVEEQPTMSLRDTTHKQQLNQEANRLLRNVSTIADAVVGIALSTARDGESRRDSAFNELSLRILDALSGDSERQARAFEDLEGANQQMLTVGKPGNAPPRIPFHWPVAMPEVFGGARRGFDAIVGNPPFMGGKKISGPLGVDYRTYLLEYIGRGKRGNADLVAYFFLRAAELADSIALLAVNTIAQGDTRDVALDPLESRGWRIVRAVKSRAWPGAAGVHISQVWLSRDADLQRPVLENVPVTAISPMLTEARRVLGNPFRLAANAGIAFQGATILGLGFTLSPSDANQLIQRDANNADVIFPYLSAEDLCTRPDLSASRWVINFFDWPIERAKQYPDCFDILVRTVKADREARGKAFGKLWWQYWRRRPDLSDAIKDLAHVIVFPRVSKVVLPLVCSVNTVFSDRLAVIARADLALFGVLSSTIHRDWARRFSGTLETRTNYSPSDCFETFAFPAIGGNIEAIMQPLDEYRSGLMRERNLGLTSLYNLVHDRLTTDSDIAALRQYHVNLDMAVARAYGWDDLDFDYDFHETDEGLRWSLNDEARSELLDRLLELNHSRHYDEINGVRVGPCAQEMELN